LPHKSRAFWKVCLQLCLCIYVKSRIAMTDYSAERRHMVDGQVRPADVTDLRVISAMLEVPRERFVPPAAAGLAYLDLDLPVGGGRRLLKPMALAKLLNAAEIAATDRVLVVGAATGYTAAVLGQIAGHVVAVEEDANLAAAAKAALSSQPNVEVVSGPLVDGWPKAGPYDVIIFEGATEVEPQAFCSQLKDGGGLVCILGVAPGMKAMLYRRSGEELGGRAIFDAAACLLPGFAKKPVFAF